MKERGERRVDPSTDTDQRLSETGVSRDMNKWETKLDHCTQWNSKHWAHTLSSHFTPSKI